MAPQKAGIFVGRKENIEQLNTLLSNHLVDSNKRVRIISIYGKSGVGKSYLVNHVLSSFNAKLKNHLILRISYSKNVYSLASIFTGQLLHTARGNVSEFKNLQKSKRVIANIDEDFILKSIKDKDRNAEIKNKLNEIGVVGVKGFFGYVKNKSGIALDIPEEDVRDLIKNLPKDSHNAIDRIFNTKKYRIDYNIEREFANDLLNDITEMARHDLLHRKHIRSLIFIIDDYEAMQPFVESILLNNLVGRLKEQSFNSLFIFIGREELEWNTFWRIHDDAQEPSIELKVFSADEANVYLQRKGINDPSEIKRIIEKSHQLPLLLEILSNAVINNTEAKWIEDYFERITAHMDSQEKEWLKRFSFLDTRVDEDMMTIMLGDNREEAKRAFEWFKKEGTAYINTSDGWEVDPIVKSLVREKVKQDSFSETNSLTERAKFAAQKYRELKEKYNT